MRLRWYLQKWREKERISLSGRIWQTSLSGTKCAFNLKKAEAEKRADREASETEKERVNKQRI